MAQVGLQIGCTSCGTILRASVSPGTMVRIRCPKCSSIQTVQGPAESVANSSALLNEFIPMQTPLEVNWRPGRRMHPMARAALMIGGIVIGLIFISVSILTASLVVAKRDSTKNFFEPEVKRQAFELKKGDVTIDFDAKLGEVRREMAANAAMLENNRKDYAKYLDLAIEYINFSTSQRILSPTPNVSFVTRWRSFVCEAATTGVPSDAKIPFDEVTKLTYAKLNLYDARAVQQSQRESSFHTNQDKVDAAEKATDIVRCQHIMDLYCTIVEFNPTAGVDPDRKTVASLLNRAMNAMGTALRSNKFSDAEVMLRELRDEVWSGYQNDLVGIAKPVTWNVNFDTSSISTDSAKCAGALYVMISREMAESFPSSLRLAQLEFELALCARFENGYVSERVTSILSKNSTEQLLASLKSVKDDGSKATIGLVNFLADMQSTESGSIPGRFHWPPAEVDRYVVDAQGRKQILASQDGRSTLSYLHEKGARVSIDRKQGFGPIEVISAIERNTNVQEFYVEESKDDYAFVCFDYDASWERLSDLLQSALGAKLLVNNEKRRCLHLAKVK
jgi:phage FluMu protein Com